MEISDKAQRQVNILNDRLLRSTAQLTSDILTDMPSRMLGEIRQKLILRLLHNVGPTLPETIAAALAINHASNLSTALGRIEKKGLIREVPIVSRHYRRLIGLTPKGHRQALQDLEKLRLDGEARGAHATLNESRYRRPERFNEVTLLHDLTCHALALSLNSKEIALDRHLHGMPTRKPDAVCRFDDGETIAIEYDKSNLSSDRTEKRLLECQRVLQPQLGNSKFDDEPDDQPGAGGIDGWTIFCRSPAQIRKYQRVLDRGFVTIITPLGVERDVKLSRNRFEVILTRDADLGPFEAVSQRLEECMPSQ